MWNWILGGHGRIAAMIRQRPVVGVVRRRVLFGIIIIIVLMVVDCSRMLEPLEWVAGRHGGWR